MMHHLQQFELGGTVMPGDEEGDSDSLTESMNE